jgi:hypothetical protein
MTTTTATKPKTTPQPAGRAPKIRRRLQEGCDATGATVVRPKWPRFSPEKLTGEAGRGVVDDAFNKVNDAEGVAVIGRQAGKWLSPVPLNLP